jgi:hypothetical protein
MADHPQSNVTVPAEEFRETFLYWIESPEHHAAVRRFGDLLGQLVGEGKLVVRNPNEHPPTGTWVCEFIHAVLLDVAHLRAQLVDIADNVGAPLPANEVRLMIAVADLMPELDAWIAKLRAGHAAAAAGKGASDAD